MSGPAQGGQAVPLLSRVGFPRHPADNPWLDMLRTLAVALVLMRHGHRAWLGVNGLEPIGPLDYLMLNGWAGVDLFFVLSGYLIGVQLLRDRGQGFHLAYFRRRARRILPAYLAVLAAVAVGLFPYFSVSRDDPGWRLAYHLLFLQDYLPSDINVVLWSLGVEAKFYLIAPVLVAILAGLRPGVLAAVVLALLAAAPLWRGLAFAAMPEVPSYETFWPALRSPFHACLEPLLLGLAVAWLARRGPPLRQAGAARAVLGGALAAFLVWAMSHEFMSVISLWDAGPAPVLLAFLFAASVAAAVSLAAVPLPGEPAFRVGARLSYALYLVHYPLLPLSVAMTQALGGGPVSFWAAFIGLSFAVAYVLHVLIERPFLAPRRVPPGAQRTPA